MDFFPIGEKTEAGIIVAAKLALKFVILGVVWIVLSDVYLIIDPDNIFSKFTHLHIFKGVLFVTACGAFLFYLILTHHSALREKEDEVTVLFYTSPIPTWFLEEESLKILSVNPAACLIFGYTHHEMLHMRMTDLSEESDFCILGKTIRDARNPVSQHIIFSFKTRAGSIIYARVFPGRSRFKGKKAYFISILDISSQLKAEKELEIMNSTFRQSLESEKESLIQFNQELMYRLRQTEGVNEELIYVNEELQKANRRLAEQNSILEAQKNDAAQIK